MIEIKQQIEETLKGILLQRGIQRERVQVEIPTDSQHGDLTSNIAMQLSKDLKSNPMEIASEIVSSFPKDDNIAKIEVVKPGFINFFFSDKYLFTVLDRINNDENYFNLDILKGKKYIIEYTDPNPFKVFHIGHLYTNMVGESLACLVEALGASVVRANYQGDVGLHVAKTIWGLMEMLKNESRSFESLNNLSLEERMRYLGDAYMLGFKMYDDLKDEKIISQIKDINHFVFCMFIPCIEKREYKFDTVLVKEIYFKGREWSLEYFEKIYRRTGTKFDKYYFESKMGERGLEIVMDNIDSKGENLFTRSKGAIVYEGDESKGLHTRVFVNNEGLPTYEAKELALPFRKYEDTEFDKSITITADEQSSYFKVIFDALSQLDKELAKKSEHISHGMVKLPGARKMSSRKGQIIEGEWLLNETAEKVGQLMYSSGKWQRDQIVGLSESIAVGAIKYAFIRVGIGRDVIFDFEDSITFDGDTGPYLLYVYARCNSILKGADFKYSHQGHIEVNAYTKELVRVISRYKEYLITASLNYSPSSLCAYLFELGQTFNTFYQNVRVLDSKDRDFLLSVVNATAQIVKHGLNALGIGVVDRM